MKHFYLLWAKKLPKSTDFKRLRLESGSRPTYALRRNLSVLSAYVRENSVRFLLRVIFPFPTHLKTANSYNLVDFGDISWSTLTMMGIGKSVEPTPPSSPLTDDLRVLHINRKRTPRRRGGNRKWLVVGACVLVAAVIAFAAARVNLASLFGTSTKSVRVAVATRGVMGGSQQGSMPVLSAGGYIIARNQVEIGSKITGRVISLEVKEGDSVTQGQITARLDDQEIQAQVRQAEAKLAVAKSQLLEAQAGARPQELDREAAEVRRVEAELKNAEQSMRRTESLIRAGVVAQQELDDARSRYESTLASYRAAQKTRELVAVGPRTEAVNVARAVVREVEADLSLAKAQRENTIIRAPMSGVVLDRYVDVGEMVTTGFTSDRGAKQALLSIADTQDLQIEADVSESDIAKVEIGQPVTMTPDAYSDRQYKGVVEYIASTGDRQKATVKVKVKVLDPDKFLRPNIGAKVTFYKIGAEVREGTAHLIVPAEAVTVQNGRAFLYVARDGAAVRRNVEVGREEGGYMQVLTGLQERENVILSREIKDGDKISIES